MHRAFDGADNVATDQKYLGTLRRDAGAPSTPLPVSRGPDSELALDGERLVYGGKGKPFLVRHCNVPADEGVDVGVSPAQL